MELGKKFTYDPNMVYGDTPIDTVASSSSGDKKSRSSSSITAAATDDEDYDFEDSKGEEREKNDGGEDSEDTEDGKDASFIKKRGAKFRCSLSSLPNTKNTKTTDQGKGITSKRDRDNDEKVMSTKRKSSRLN